MLTLELGGGGVFNCLYCKNGQKPKIVPRGIQQLIQKFTSQSNILSCVTSDQCPFLTNFGENFDSTLTT